MKLLTLGHGIFILFLASRVEFVVNSFHIRLATYPTTNLATNPQSRQSAQSASVPLWFQRGTHSLAGKGVGGPNSDEGTDIVVL
jgi:hypothetical protein